MAPAWSFLSDAGGKDRRARSGLFPLQVDGEWSRLILMHGGWRLSRRERAQACLDAEHAVRALNWMAGNPLRSNADGDVPGPSADKIGAVQEVGYTNIAKAVVDVRDAESSCAAEGAYKELLRGRGGDYVAAATAQASLATFQSRRVSIPEDVHNAPRIELIIPPLAQQYLEEYEQRMLRGKDEKARIDEECGPAKKHNDARLFGSRGLYRAYVRRLVKSGLFKLKRSCKEKVGMFFVRKKNGELRLILDCRPSNRHFVTPPGVYLATFEAFARIEVTGEEDGGIGGLADAVGMEAELALGVCDVKDCFHRMRIAEWLSEYFGLEELTAEELGVVGEEIDGRVCEAKDVLYPCCASLPIGFAWSLYFAQAATSHQFSRTPGLEESQELIDRGAVVVLNWRFCKKKGRYVYVDNMGVLGYDFARVEGATVA